MKLGIVHASRAAVDAVAEYYKAEEAAWEITHLLDDGVMRMLLRRDWRDARDRLLWHVRDLQRAYRIEVALLTCSALPVEELIWIGEQAGIPVEKIDVPMARKAAGLGRRVGVLSTFPSTQETTRDLLRWAARGEALELIEELEFAALEALLRGDARRHDTLFFAALERMRGRVDVVVLAQVSMARLAAEAGQRLGVPVLESLSTSLDSLRARLQPSGSADAS